jgi:putative hydrolase
MGGLFLLLNEEQREIVRHVQGVMSLLEGHASFVMNEVAKDHVQDLDRMRKALSERRRRAGSIERSFQRAIGFDKKIEQYDAGERFVREVVAHSGMEGFNRAWLAPEGLPTVEEIAEPSLWIARVAGS